MSSEQKTESNNVYYSVFDQKFRTRVAEGYPDALPRINKLGKQVFEREVSALFGKIEDVAIEDSDFGKQIKITLDKNEDGKHPVLTFGVESKNGRDILKLLPAVDFSQEVRILPYRFTPDDKTDEVSGISIAQKDADGKYTKKIGNHFYNPDTKTYLHGYPTIDWDKATDAEKKIYKIQRDDFLVQYLKKTIANRFAEKPEPAKEPIQYPDEEISPDSIPF